VISLFVSGYVCAFADGVAGEPRTVAAASDPTVSTAPLTEQTEKTEFKLTGFRSAYFGADEADVRAAAIKDFGVPASAIQKSQNLADRTELLTVKVSDVLKDGGAAEVIYVLGYKSKKLTQVSIVWSNGTDKDITPERLLANGEALKSYFMTEGYVPSSIVGDTGLRDGILLFRGADAEGHTTALMLRGETSGAADKPRHFSPNALLLVYLADPKAPDVFRIQAGKF